MLDKLTLESVYMIFNIEPHRIEGHFPIPFSFHYAIDI